MKIFLDTNVWIDFLLERKPFYTLAASVISYADLKSYKICISSLTAVNAHYICCERLKMPVNILTAKMQALNDMLDICNVTQEDILKSYTDAWPDFEDGVQCNAAIRADATCIVSRNKKDFILAAIPILTPEEFIQIEKKR